MIRYVSEREEIGRGIAILMTVVYHATCDPDAFGGHPIKPTPARLSNPFIGLFVFAAGAVMMAYGASSEGPWLLPLGVVPEGLPMPDYRPLLPWFGVALVGVISSTLVPRRSRGRCCRSAETRSP